MKKIISGIIIIAMLASCAGKVNGLLARVSSAAIGSFFNCERVDLIEKDILALMGKDENFVKKEALLIQIHKESGGDLEAVALEAKAMGLFKPSLEVKGMDSRFISGLLCRTMLEGVLLAVEGFALKEEYKCSKEFSQELIKQAIDRACRSI